MRNPAKRRQPYEVVPTAILSGHGKHDQASPHTVFRPNGTEYWILEYVVSGGAYVRSGGKSHSASPYELLLFQPRLPQDYGMDRELKSFEHYWVAFTPRSAWFDWMRWPTLISGVLGITLPNTELCSDLSVRLRQLIEIGRGPLARRVDFAYNMLEGILLWCDTVNPQSSSARIDPRIQRGLEFLCDHHTQKITLEELASVCHLSLSRMSHLFKAQTGMTPLHYLEVHRVQKAQGLLMMTSKSVSEIAYLVGFMNPLYFSRIFSRHTGRSPREFRKEQG